MSFDESRADDPPAADAVPAAPPPISAGDGRREPAWVLALGILLFLAVIVTYWGNSFRSSARNTGEVGFQRTMAVRLSTYAVSALVYLQYQQSGQAQTRELQQSLALSAAREWTAIGNSSTRRAQGLQLLNAAALYGVADNSAQARDALQRAARAYPEAASSFRQLTPLYQQPPSAITVTPGVRALTKTVSTGPLLLARNERLQGDTPGALAALRPGAVAGARALVAVGGIVIVTVLLILIGLFLYAIKWRRVTADVREAELTTEQPLPWGVGTALILISMVYLGAPLLFVPLLVRAFGAPAPATSVAYSAIATIGSAVLVLGLYLMAHGRNPWEWGVFGWQRARAGIGYGLVVLMMALPLFYLASIISNILTQAIPGAEPETHPLVPILSNTHSTLLIVFMLLVAAVMAPLVEETLFRGLLFRALGARMSFWGAAVLNGLIFGVVHGQFVAILPIAILGMTFAFLTRRSGSLVSSAAAHAGYNAFITLEVLILAWAMRGPGA